MIADIAIVLTLLYVALGVMVTGFKMREVPRRMAYQWQDIVYWPMKRKYRDRGDD